MPPARPTPPWTSCAGRRRTSLSQCLTESQTTLATTSIAPEAGKQYMKVICSTDRPS